MKPRFRFVAKRLQDAKRSNLHRKMKYGRVSGPRITIGTKSLLNLCSNDYLGMPPRAGAMMQTQSSSRLVSGNDESYRKLEKRLARLKSYGSSLVYPTGYMANIGVVTALAGKGDLILSDERNHASIIDACRLSSARTLVYRHNDPKDLERKMRQDGKNKFVITEGIFSMDGDYAVLPEIAEAAQRSGAIVILDDAHGDFAVGQDGRGTPDKLRVSRHVDVYTSSLSKALGSFGGYVASDMEVIDLCINASRSFIYTSALPSFLVDYTIRRLDADRAKYQRRLENNTRALASGLRGIGFDVASETHIIPMILGSEKTAVDMAGYMFRRGVFIQPIRYPTVPRGSARLRVSVTAWLSDEDIADALRAFEKAAVKFGI